MRRLAVAIVCATVVGCAADPSFHCEEDAQCGTTGRCESTGYCTLEDAACATGRRYEAHAGDLAGRCLDLVMCATDADCGGEEVCEASGSCSYADATCGAGFRYTDTAEPGLRGTCLERYELEFGERTGADVTNVTDDARIDASAPTNNYGTADLLACSELTPTRSLLRFELQALPPDASIERVELSIHNANNDGNSVTLYPILEAWREGTQNTSPGAPNWTERAASTPWGSAGLETSPSIEATATATIPPSAADEAHTILINDWDRIRGWRDDPATNHGWLLRSDGGNGVAFHSSEAADASKRPVLRIVFRR